MGDCFHKKLIASQTGMPAPVDGKTGIIVVAATIATTRSAVFPRSILRMLWTLGAFFAIRQVRVFPFRSCAGSKSDEKIANRHGFGRGRMLLFAGRVRAKFVSRGRNEQQRIWKRVQPVFTGSGYGPPCSSNRRGARTQQADVLNTRVDETKKAPDGQVNIQFTHQQGPFVATAAETGLDGWTETTAQ